MLVFARSGLCYVHFTLLAERATLFHELIEVLATFEDRVDGFMLWITSVFALAEPYHAY